MLTSRRFAANEALRIGLVTDVVDPDVLPSAVSDGRLAASIPADVAIADQARHLAGAGDPVLRRDGRAETIFSVNNRRKRALQQEQPQLTGGPARRQPARR
jgi:enoyl-CoA hydratase/carnithine racemase